MVLEKFEPWFGKSGDITREAQVRNAQGGSSEEGEVADKEEIEAAEEEREAEEKSSE